MVDRTMQATMQADMMQVSGTDIDVSPLVGTWVNVKPDTKYVSKVVLTQQDGKLLIRPYGTPDAELLDWGEAEATPHVFSGTTAAGGLHAQCLLGDVRTELAATENQGVLALQVYTSFHDDSGRASHFAREYFHRLAADEQEPEIGGMSTGSIAGDWVNTNLATTWITGFTLVDDAGTFTMRVRGANEPTDWGESGVVIYQDKIGETAFRAAYDLGKIETVLAANTNKNLIVVNEFHQFKDSEATNFFCREFFHRP